MLRERVVLRWRSLIQLLCDGRDTSVRFPTRKFHSVYLEHRGADIRDDFGSVEFAAFGFIR